MAYWNRHKGHVYFYSYYVKGKRQKKPKQIPRKQYSELDGASDEVIEQWRLDWERRWEKNDKFDPESIILSDSLITSYLEKYKAHLLKYKAKSTAVNRISVIRRYAIPYFLNNNPPLRDPQQWISISIRLLEYLEEKKLSWSMMAAINTDLRGFYNFMIEEGIIQHGRALPLRFPKKTEEDKLSPLPYIIEPQAMLNWVNKQSNYNVKLLGLLGYFCSLRPQESFGLKRSDFHAKPSTLKDLDCVKVMEKVGLFTKFVVHIDRQRDNYGAESDPKGLSRGFAACFNQEAATLIVGLISKLKPEEYLFSKNNKSLYDLWSEAKLGLTLKDLRRSSIRYLGYETRFSESPLLLKDHARHEEFETTLLYLRPPVQNSADDQPDELDITTWNTEKTDEAK